MLVIIIRDGKELSIKSNFVLRILKSNSNIKFLHVYRKEHERFIEKRFGNTVNLATSPSRILLYFSLMQIMKAPKDIHDGIIRRIFRKKPFPLLIKYGGFLTVVSQAMYQSSSNSARTDNLMNFLTKSNVSKLFIIDEFYSLNVANLKKLSALGPVIYVSSDLAYDMYSDNRIASKLFLRFERKSISLPDLVIACSERDQLKYTYLGARKVFYYPNIYPDKEFKLGCKDEIPSISIVLRGHWGRRNSESLEKVFEAFGHINKKMRVYMFGTKPRTIPKNIELIYYDYVQSKLDYLRVLSKSWIGINLGIHAGGANQRKYDYAMAGLVVISDNFGVRGDLVPNEYSYFDTADLTAKLRQVLELGRERIQTKGIQNRKYVLRLAEKQRKHVETAICDVLNKK
jgi:hypothetical protein